MKAQGGGGTPCPLHHDWIFPGYCLTRIRAWGTKTRVRMLKRPLSPGHVGPLQAEMSLPVLLPPQAPSSGPGKWGGQESPHSTCHEAGGTKGTCANGASCCLGHSGGKTKNRSGQLQFWLLNSNPQAAQGLLEPESFRNKRKLQGTNPNFYFIDGDFIDFTESRR